MSCVHPTAEYWRKKMRDGVDDAELAYDFNWLWLESRNEVGPPYGSSHHDYTAARAITLREARKRGFDLSIAKLGT